MENGQNFIKSLTACQSKEGATDEDVTLHMGFQEAMSHAGKCLASCMEELFGIVIKLTCQLTNKFPKNLSVFNEGSQTCASALIPHARLKRTTLKSNFYFIL